MASACQLSAGSHATSSAFVTVLAGGLQCHRPGDVLMLCVLAGPSELSALEISTGDSSLEPGCGHWSGYSLGCLGTLDHPLVSPSSSPWPRTAGATL